MLRCKHFFKLIQSVTRMASSDLLSDGANSVNIVADVAAPTETSMSKRMIKRLKRQQLRLASKFSSDSSTAATRLPHSIANKRAALQQDADVIKEICLRETDYYFENGLRKVYPYHYQYTMYAKGRWFGERLLDIFVKEFGVITAETCTAAIESGAIKVNGKCITVDYRIVNGDFITNQVHRHELPVTADKVEVIAEDSDVVIVNKPSSIPIHPCGRYRHNSLLYILAKEHGYNNLRGIYRLDRLTSGLLIFCKTEQRCSEMMTHIRQRQVVKEYVCRVRGEFPSGVVECIQPIDILSHKLGVYKVGPNGKESSTTFERLSSNGTSSVVICKPHTGRTHQIRIHLQFLGYPIVNDPLYSGEVWGPNQGKAGEYGKTDEQIIADLKSHHSSSQFLETGDDIVSDLTEIPADCEAISHTMCESLTNFDCDAVPVGDVTPSNHLPSCEMPPEKRFKPDDAEQLYDNDLRMTASADPPLSRTAFDERCAMCKQKYRDPRPDELVMYLHAYRYKGPNWEYKTDLPPWALDNLHST